MQFQDKLSFAQKLDQQDPLKSFREKFHIPIINCQQAIYFCGNSLGLQPKQTKEYIDQELKTWEELGVEGHFKGPRPWYSYHKFVKESLAKLIGAHQDGLMWFCDNCNHKLHEAYFALTNIEKDFLPRFKEFYASEDSMPKINKINDG